MKILNQKIKPPNVLHQFTKSFTAQAKEKFTPVNSKNT